MKYEKKSIDKYKETSIKTASPIKIIVMLYDEAIAQLEYAMQLLDNKTKQLDKVNNAIGKTQDIITELLVSLNMQEGGEIAHNLFRLYMFFNKLLTQANLQKENSSELQSVHRMLSELRESWHSIQDKVSPSSHSQSEGNINIIG